MASALAVGAEEFVVPPLTAPVMDLAGVLNSKTEDLLTNAISALRDKGGSQITVLTVSSLGGLPIEQASIKIVDQWKLGGRKADNGVLLLLAPNERKVRIEVGQGLEGVLPDAYAKRIIELDMIPLLKEREFDSAVIAGTYRVTSITDPGIDLTPYFEGAIHRRPGRSRQISLHLKLLAIFFLWQLFRIIAGRRSYGDDRFIGPLGRRWNTPTSVRRTGRLGSSSYDPGYEYDGGFSGGGAGGGSGGWSGGGGGFSGGGASGSW